jgi:hypothetical protein
LAQAVECLFFNCKSPELKPQSHQKMDNPIKNGNDENSKLKTKHQNSEFINKKYIHG